MLVIENGFVDNLDDDKAQMILLMTTISMLIAAMVEHLMILWWEGSALFQTNPVLNLSLFFTHKALLVV